MEVNIKPGDLSNDMEFKEFLNIIEGRTGDVHHFNVDMDGTTTMNLARFNSLVALYVKLRRLGKRLNYSNLREPVRTFVDKRNFHHVFRPVVS